MPSKTRVKFRFVLFDVWFSSVANMKFILKHRKHFICPLKSNRKVALSRNDKLCGRWHKLETVEIETYKSRLIYLEGLELPVLLIKQVFTNEDGTTAVQYLISSDTTLLPNDIIRSYHKRWRVEEYHKSLKQNVSLEKSQAADRHDPNESLFRRRVRLYQTGEIENQDQTKSFCFEIEIISQSLNVSFSNSPATKSRSPLCVR